jgi:hypothetical protein
MNPSHLLYMGYDIVMNFVGAYLCRYLCIHNCGFLQENLLNGILILEVEATNPKFFLMLKIMLFDVYKDWKQLLCFIFLFHLMLF